jgi:hypothetical protein
MNRIRLNWICLKWCGNCALLIGGPSKSEETELIYSGSERNDGGCRITYKLRGLVYVDNIVAASRHSDGHCTLFIGWSHGIGQFFPFFYIIRDKCNSQRMVSFLSHRWCLLELNWSHQPEQCRPRRKKCVAAGS